MEEKVIVFDKSGMSTNDLVERLLQCGILGEKNDQLLIKNDAQSVDICTLIGCYMNG